MNTYRFYSLIKMHQQIMSMSRSKSLRTYYCGSKSKYKIMVIPISRSKTKSHYYSKSCDKEWKWLFIGF